MKKLFCYPKWSSCRKARNWLDANDYEYEYVDITLTPPDEKTIKKLFESNDYAIKKFFNTAGVVYKELKLKDKLDSMTEEECFSLLASNGKLIKRPFFIYDDILLIGYKEEIWEKSLK